MPAVECPRALCSRIGGNFPRRKGKKVISSFPSEVISKSTVDHCACDLVCLDISLKLTIKHKQGRIGLDRNIQPS